ncbi:armadillo repeat-containing X-linked protein 1 isoform X2 [Saimiri boliviensis]|uniref:armadillo repeat-containing X-linked protein 1 isoform X2 n=1 Tax=Saimiri boliviensis TaxID=27679 RepID=UPI00193D4689|nr:armadillo repeat-containing X-linked protein 1 isoform X2 [Saimiri boliviensis boliviensis]
MGVVIGVLISRVTWPSRELEPTSADVLLILVFIWSGCLLSISQRARRSLAWGKEEEGTVPFGNKGIVRLDSAGKEYVTVPTGKVLVIAELEPGSQSNPWKKRKVVQNQVQAASEPAG